MIHPARGKQEARGDVVRLVTGCPAGARLEHSLGGEFEGASAKAACTTSISVIHRSILSRPYDARVMLQRHCHQMRPPAAFRNRGCLQQRKVRRRVRQRPSVRLTSPRVPHCGKPAAPGADIARTEKVRGRDRRRQTDGRDRSDGRQSSEHGCRSRRAWCATAQRAKEAGSKLRSHAADGRCR